MNENKAITKRDEDFAKWYTDVVMAAKLARYSNVKGCIIYEPNGTAIWEKIQEVMDKKFKETGHRNVQMPMLIPENLLKKEGELVEGFAPEVAWVTQGGNKVLDERLCIRPTSETLFSDYYHEIVKSYTDGKFIDYTVCSFDDLEINIKKQMQLFNSAIYVVIFFASFMALVIISVIANIVVEENKKTISLMKVMGYKNDEISSVVLNIYTPFVIIAYLLSIPAMISILKAIVKILTKDTNMSFPIEISPFMAIVGLISLVVSYYIAIYLSRRALNKVPLAEALKRE